MSRAAKVADKIVKLSRLAGLWNAFYGSGKSPVESAEQRIIRRWLQGETDRDICRDWPSLVAASVGPATETGSVRQPRV